MKIGVNKAWVMALGLGWAVLARAQTADTNSVSPSSALSGAGQVVLPGSGAMTEVSGSSPLVQPARPERLNLPQEVRQRIMEFEKMREAYLAKQKELTRQLRGATDEDRQKIREMLRDQREAWLEQARRFRDEAQRRMEELKSRLPDHTEALAPARERAAELQRNSQGRPRR